MIGPIPSTFSHRRARVASAAAASFGMAAALLLALALVVSDVNAQSLSPFGRRFLIPFPDTTHTQTSTIVNTLAADVRIAIFSFDTANVTVSAPGYSKSLRVVPSAASVVWLNDPISPAPKFFIDSVNAPRPGAFEVRSDRPVSVVCSFVTIDGSEAFTPLPVDQWGTEYRAMSLRNQYVYNVYGQEENKNLDDAPGQVLLVASQDGTEITISGTPLLKGPLSMPIRLNAGETWLLETAPPLSAYDTARRDFSGMLIRSNHPVGVLSGNTRTEVMAGESVPGMLTGNSFRNVAIEWLRPTSSFGTTFVYRPMSPVDENTVAEIVRVYATAPGMTSVVTSNGGLVSVAQGGFAEFNTLTWRKGPVAEAFAIHTSAPSQAMVVSAPAMHWRDSSTFTSANTWSPAMAELVPREAWITSGRLYAPPFPSIMKHYVVIVADSSARVLIDSKEIAFDSSPVTGTPLRHARVEIDTGDHFLHSIGGRFSAIAFGQARGYEAFEPPKTRKGDDDAPLAHVSKYIEKIAISYAYPVPGLAEGPELSDSLQISRLDRCDSSVVTVTRVGDPWALEPLELRLDPFSTNTDAVIVPIPATGVPIAWRIRFSPRDKSLDASGRVLIESISGRVRTIEYSSAARMISFDPSPIEILGATAGVERTMALTLTNRKSFTTTLLSIRPQSAPSRFSVRGLDQPKPLAAGGSFQITLAFTGPDAATDYIDSLIVETECGTYTVPVLGRTAPPDPAPVPRISGYDWRERHVGSAYDTLSFISNAGNIAFAIDSLYIADDAAGVFQLVAPDWRTLGPVGSGERAGAGIRFAPVTEGDFTARVVLIGGGDTVWAPLHGSARLAGIGVDDVNVGVACIESGRDTSIAISASGTTSLTIRSLAVATDGIATIALDTAGRLPRTLAPGDTLRLDISIAPLSAGTFSATLVATSDAGTGDSVATISGTSISCSSAGVTVDSLDFGQVWITTERQGFVTLSNRGGVDVMIRGMNLVDDTASAFRVVSTFVPFLLRDGDTAHIDCAFLPMTVGPKGAMLVFATDVGPLYSTLRGVGAKLIVPAFIRRDYHAPPGEEVWIDVEIAQALPSIPLDTLNATIGFDHRLLGFREARLGKDSNNGATITGGDYGDSLRFTIAMNGNPLDSGTLVKLRFLTAFTPLDSSELPFTIECTVPYVEFVESPGLFRRDPYCGLLQRLFELVGHELRLEQNRPNPATGATTIEFELPFDNHTTLIVYDALGAERVRLVDGPLAAGAYTFTLDATTLSAGLYYYRLQSGEFSLTRKMIVR